jgi:lysine decarboxylase
LFVPETGTTGARIAAELWGQGVGVEAADADTLVMTVTVADDPADVKNLVAAIATVVDRQRDTARTPAPAATWQIQPDVVLTPREAYFAHRRRIPLRDAIGEVSTEQFCPYPPGVPLLAPGERVTSEVVDAIDMAGRTTRMAYCSDPTAQTIEIVDRERVSL